MRILFNVTHKNVEEKYISSFTFNTPIKQGYFSSSSESISGVVAQLFIDDYGLRKSWNQSNETDTLVQALTTHWQIMASRGQLFELTINKIRTEDATYCIFQMFGSLINRT